MATQLKYCEMKPSFINDVGRLVLIVIGAPGSGKGTQCEKVASYLRIPHISTGTMLRNHNAQLSSQDANSMIHGDLISDAVVCSLLTNRMSAVDCVRGFILDGFPRTVNQAQLLDSYLCKAYPDGYCKVVVELVASKATVTRRLSARHICPLCNSVFSNANGGLSTVDTDFENQEKHQYEEFTSPYSGLAQVIRPDGLYQSQTRFGLYRWHITDPIRFDSDLRVTIQDLGWQSGGRYLPLMDDISSVAFWYQTEPHNPFPKLPNRDFLQDN